MAALWRGCGRLLARRPGAAQALTAGKGRPCEPEPLRTLCDTVAQGPLALLLWALHPRWEEHHGSGGGPSTLGVRVRGKEMLPFPQAQRGAGARHMSYCAKSSGLLQAQEIGGRGLCTGARRAGAGL